MNTSSLKNWSLGIGLTLMLVVQAAGAELRVNDSFPDLHRFGLEGSLPRLEGRVLLIDFWASWCAPCKTSFPALEELQQRYGLRGFDVIAINVDQSASAMQSFLKKQKVSFQVVRDAQKKLVAEVDVATMPASFLVDAQGKVRFVHHGYRGEETKRQYENEIRQLLGGPASSAADTTTASADLRGDSKGSR